MIPPTDPATTWLLWLVALATIIAALPSIVWYAWPAAKRAGADRERWGMAMYLITRSFALAAVALAGAVLAEPGLVLGVAIATIVVQALDIAVAVGRRKLRDAFGAGLLAMLVLAAVLAFAMLTG
ncbi:hypothetical protein ACFC1I_08160 [Microbacterium sp. NPDC056044]|uniref:hypothetical protein n=1 Tax=Microbacterium sp. NPDC056044 TaxID=3345690 RepID=UPI0035D89F90